MSVIPKPIEFWRSAKQHETLARFPFLQEPRWRRWLGLARPRVASDPVLRIHHALTPFRQMGEVARARFPDEHANALAQETRERAASQDHS